jgi:hypothetical protein
MWGSVKAKRGSSSIKGLGNSGLEVGTLWNFSSIFDRYDRHVSFLKVPERPWNLLDFLLSGYQELSSRDRAVGTLSWGVYRWVCFYSVLVTCMGSLPLLSYHLITSALAEVMSCVRNTEYAKSRYTPSYYTIYYILYTYFWPTLYQYIFPVDTGYSYRTFPVMN